MTDHELLDAIGDIDEDLLQLTSDKVVRMPSVKRFTVLTAALLLMCLTITALACTSPDVNEWLHSRWPWFTQALKPVNLCCEDNGIRMEVVSASLEGREAFVYISMQDLTGHRIDATTDLFDSAHLILPYDGSGTCQLVSFDEETEIATFMVYMKFDTDVVPSGNATFEAHCFLTGKQTSFVDLTELIDWEQALTPYAGIPRSAFAGGFSGNPICDAVSGNELIELADRLPVLPDEAAVSLPFAPGMTVCGLGMIDQTVRIRVRSEDNLRTDNHCSLTLTDQAGDAVQSGCLLYSPAGDPVFDVSHRSWIDGNDQVTEFIFDLTGVDREGLRLTAECVTADPAVTGSWSVTFPMEIITSKEAQSAP